MRSRRIWLPVVAAVALTVSVAALGSAHAWRTSEARLPGVCDRGIVPFCADPSWPDAGVTEP